MNILLTNDDGYNAPGIHRLAEALNKKHSVYIVAPEKEMSGTSHSVSFFSGITYRKINCDDAIGAFAVSGSPGDCVLFGIKYLMPDIKFDVVLSGINNVWNVGTDVLYSGTFGAAQEATFLRHIGIAVSVRAGNEENYFAAAKFIKDNLSKLVELSDTDCTLNVNVPTGDETKIKGVKIAPLSFHPYDEKFKKQIAHDGSEVFFVSGTPCPFTAEHEGGDCKLVHDGYITITPVKLLSNCPERLEKLKTAEFVL